MSNSSVIEYQSLKGFDLFIILMISKLNILVAIQKRRYSNKGILNNLIAFSLFVGIMWTAVTLGKTHWPEQIQDKSHFILIGSFCCHISIQFITFFFYLPGYLNWSSYYAQHQINKQSQWPWERKNWTESRMKLITNLVMNQLIFYPLAVYLSNLRGFRVRFDNFPEFGEVIAQIIIMNYIDDFFFYWAHRFFHTPYLYRFHKVHHEYDTPFTWISVYFHPVDFLFGNLFPTALGFIILGNRLHCFTFFYYICWKAIVSNEAHSGYELDWSPTRIIPFVVGASYHDHHHSHNVGNFSGRCYLWDLILETNGPYIKEFLKDNACEQEPRMQNAK